MPIRILSSFPPKKLSYLYLILAGQRFSDPAFLIMNKFDGVFSILGPDMVGPSSSHTAGAVRIGNVARSILNGELLKVKFILYNSFAETGKGHGTDKALLAGVMNLDKSNPQIKDSYIIADKNNIKYSFKYIHNSAVPANAVNIHLTSPEISVDVFAESLGGALILIHKIDGFDVNICGDYETLIVTHKDKTGILSQILNIISLDEMNIVSINSVRHNKLEDIKTVITFDNEILNSTADKIKILNSVKRVRIIHKIRDEW